MNIIIGNSSWLLDPFTSGKIINDLYEDGYTNVDLSSHLTIENFKMFLNTTSFLTVSTEDLVKGFKVANYLNESIKMELFGKEIALRIKKSTYNGIRIILNYFHN